MGNPLSDVVRSILVLMAALEFAFGALAFFLAYGSWQGGTIVTILGNLLIGLTAFSLAGLSVFAFRSWDG
jgi:hypothetical protein